MHVICEYLEEIQRVGARQYLSVKRMMIQRQKISIHVIIAFVTLLVMPCKVFSASCESLMTLQSIPISADTSLKITTFSDDQKVNIIVDKIRKVLPILEDNTEFQPYSTESCTRKCGQFSFYLKGALISQSLITEEAFLKGPFLINHTYFLFDDIIVDASIMQFVRHAEMQGIFVGTRDELKAFVLSHPGCLSPTRYVTNPVEGLRKIWGILP